MNSRRKRNTFLTGILLAVFLSLNPGKVTFAWGNSWFGHHGENHHGESVACQVEEDGEYTSKDEVAEYIHEFEHLPDNYITRKEARELGWVSREGNLWEVAPGKSIGGDYFGNYEGTLPDKKGREYHECDIDYDGKYRGAKRIVYSSDGWIYYTEDHYETFEVLYEGE